MFVSGHANIGVPKPESLCDGFFWCKIAMVENVCGCNGAPLFCNMMPQEFCTEEKDGKPAICTKLIVTEAKPEKQTW